MGTGLGTGLGRSLGRELGSAVGGGVGTGLGTGLGCAVGRGLESAVGCGGQGTARVLLVSSGVQTVQGAMVARTKYVGSIKLETS